MSCQKHQRGAIGTPLDRDVMLDCLFCLREERDAAILQIEELERQKKAYVVIIQGAEKAAERGVYLERLISDGQTAYNSLAESYERLKAAAERVFKKYGAGSDWTEWRDLGDALAFKPKCMDDVKELRISLQCALDREIRWTKDREKLLLQISALITSNKQKDKLCEETNRLNEEVRKALEEIKANASEWGYDEALDAIDTILSKLQNRIYEPPKCCCDKVPTMGGYCQVHPDKKK